MVWTLETIAEIRKIATAVAKAMAWASGHVKGRRKKPGLACHRATRLSRLPWGNSVTQLQEGAFHRKEQSCSSGVNADFDQENSGSGCQRDVMARAELSDEMNDEFLN